MQNRHKNSGLVMLQHAIVAEGGRVCVVQARLGGPQEQTCLTGTEGVFFFLTSALSSFLSERVFSSSSSSSLVHQHCFGDENGWDAATYVTEVEVRRCLCGFRLL